MITKRKDAEFGEAMVLIVEDEDGEPYQTLCRNTLLKYECPKQVICVGQIPMTETGKPARKEAEELANRSARR